MYGHTPLGRFVTPSFTTTNSQANGAPQVGDVIRDGDEDYVYVYNTGGSSITVGDGAIISAVSGYSVTLSSTTSVDVLVGVCKHATIAASDYGFLVTKGWSQVNMGANFSAAAGGLLILADNGKFTSKTISTGFVGAGLVKTMEAIASGASGTAFISVA